jgi:hypothetical protein
MAQEKITNDDGTPSDYLIRYLRTAITNGEKSIKFPVTSVNGKTGDVIIDIEDVISNFDIDYDKLNAKIQELIAGLDAIRQEMIQKFQQHITDYHKYAFQGFMGKNYGDERMYNWQQCRNLLKLNAVSVASLGVTRVTTTFNHGLSTGDVVGFEAIEDNQVSHEIENKSYTITVTSATQFTIEFNLATYPITSLNVFARIIIKESDFADGAEQFNMPVYFPCLSTRGATIPGANDFWRQTYFRLGNTTTSNSIVTTSFGIIVIEKTIRVKRMQLPIVFNFTLANADTDNYSLHQFGLYSSGIINAVRASGWAYGDIADVSMRFPKGKIWSSGVLDTRNFRDVSGGNEWPNTIFNADAVRNGITSYTSSDFAGTTSATRVLAWDMDIYIPRGVYFLCKRSLRVGTTGTQYIGDDISPFVASGAVSNSIYDVCTSGIFLNTFWSNSSTLPCRQGRYDTTAIGADSYRSFSITDATQRSPVITTLPPLGDSEFYNYLDGENIKPLVGVTASYKDNDGITQNLNYDASYNYPLVGLAGTFADREPSDTW